MTCKFCNKECKNDNSLRNHERLCKLNPDRQLTTFEKYGAIQGFNNKGKWAWNKGLTKETDERVLLMSTNLSRKFASGEIVNAAKGKHKSDEQKRKISQSMLKICSVRDVPLCGKGKRGYYKGYYCQSSWELAFVIYNIDHNINFIRNKTGFKYILNGVEHTYYPDFYLPDTDEYVEIKGYNNDISKIKASQFKYNLKVLLYEDMKYYIQYCINKYGKNYSCLYE